MLVLMTHVMMNSGYNSDHCHIRCIPSCLCMNDILKSSDENADDADGDDDDADDGDRSPR